MIMYAVSTENGPDLYHFYTQRHAVDAAHRLEKNGHRATVRSVLSLEDCGGVIVYWSPMNSDTTYVEL